MNLDLTKLKKRFQSQSVLAITLESSRMAISLVHRENSGAMIIQSLSVCLGAEDVVRNPEQAGTDLAAALAAAGIKEHRCVVCIPPGWALTAAADLPAVDDEDLRGYFELRAEREFSLTVSDLRLAHCPYSLPDGKRRATLAAVPAKRMEAVEKMLAGAGCRPVSISLALDGCFSEPQPMLHFLVNGDHTDVVVSTGGGIAVLRSLSGPVASGDIPFDLTAFCREVRITLGRLPEPVRQQVRQARFGGDPVTVEMVRQMSRDYLQQIGIEGQGELVSEAGAGDAVGAAVECAQRVLREEAVAFEFVVVEAKRWPAELQRFNTRMGRQIAAAVLGVILLPVFAFAILSQMESSLEGEWNGMRDRVADLDALQQKIRQFRPWFEPTPQTLQAMQTLIAAFPEQGDVWTKSVQIGEGYKVSCSGFARNQPALMGFLDRLRTRPGITAVQVQQLRGDNPVQFSVTCKWEPKNEN